VIYAAQADTSQGRLTNTLAALPNAMGWRGFEEPLKLVKGRIFDEIQKQEDKAIRAKRTSISWTPLTWQGLLNGAENKTTIVFFLGGCTYTEIAALRFIAQHEGLSSILQQLTEIGKRILIATTGIINGNTIMHAALNDMSKKPAV